MSELVTWHAVPGDAEAPPLRSSARGDVAFGATAATGGVDFALWSDRVQRAAVVLFDEEGGPIWEEPMKRSSADPHAFQVFLERAEVGSLYRFKLDGQFVGDPYARSLPFGPRGPAQVVGRLDRARVPKRPVRFERGEVIYELHIGTFTPEGTFEGVRSKLAELAELGVTVLELMPIASFPGGCGWGYDGVAFFAPFTEYGTPAELCALIDAAHRAGMSVVLDVVYNHLGPDGNVLPMFSDRYFHTERKNPWGSAPALEDGPFRRFVLDSARYWLEIVGFDGLRLDAAHELEPGGDPHILKELSILAEGCSPPAVLIAEDDRNDPKASLEHGVHAVWSDDFHHSLHVLLTGERDGYYAAYEGTLSELARIIARGQLYEGQEFPVTGQPRGKPAQEVPRHALVYALQNHDQVGNRARGERLASLVDAAALRAAVLLLAFLPATPTLFMGEEWAAKEPFLYFTDHDEPLGTAITEGRRAEFAHFAAFASEPESVPDPQQRETFVRSKLRWEERETAASVALRSLWRRALGERRASHELNELETGVIGEVLWVRRCNARDARLLLFNTGPAVALDSVAGYAARDWQLVLSSVGEPEPLSLPTMSASIWSCLDRDVQ